MTGKGDHRLHARQQCSDEEMQANWDRVFGKHKSLALSDEKGVAYYYDGKPKVSVNINYGGELVNTNIDYDNPIKGSPDFFDALAGDGDTYEGKVSLSDEMQLHGDKHKPEGM